MNSRPSLSLGELRNLVAPLIGLPIPQSSLRTDSLSNFISHVLDTSLDILLHCELIDDLLL